MRSSALSLLFLLVSGIFFPCSVHADTTGVDIEIISDDTDILADGHAAAGAAILMVKQVLVGNQVVQDGIHGLALIQDSFNHGAGIFGVNQDAGNFNNQANAVAIVIGNGETSAQLLSLSIEVEQHDNVVISSNSTQQARIEGSFNGMTGIVGVNQTAGSGNNQINAMAVGVGVLLGQDAIVLHDTDLDVMTGDDDGPGDQPPPETPTIVDSFQGFRGIAQVSQANGNLNQVQNTLTISVFGVAGAQP
jgi:hypothetical protein